MDIIKQIYEIVTTSTLTLPGMEFGLLFISITLCMLMKATQLGLIVSYVFAYKWGWSLFAGHKPGVLTAYLVFGCLTGALLALELLHSPRSKSE